MLRLLLLRRSADSNCEIMYEEKKIMQSALNKRAEMSSRRIHSTHSDALNCQRTAAPLDDDDEELYMHAKYHRVIVMDMN